MATPYQNLMDMRNKAYNIARCNGYDAQMWWFLEAFFERERTYMLYDGLKAMAQNTR